MRLDPSYVILMGMIIGLLGLVYGAATFAKRRKRQIEREMLESVLQARENTAGPLQDAPEPARPPSPSSPLPYASAVPASPAPVPQPLPAVKPAPPKPRPKALIAWIPPVSEGPPRFTQYITWPGTKIATPVAERAPAEKDYVWD